MNPTTDPRRNPATVNEPSTLASKVLRDVLHSDVMRPKLTTNAFANAHRWAFLQHALQVLEEAGWLTDPTTPRLAAGGLVNPTGAAPGSYDDEEEFHEQAQGIRPPCERCGLNPWQASLLRRVLERPGPDNEPTQIPHSRSLSRDLRSLARDHERAGEAFTAGILTSFADRAYALEARQTILSAPRVSDLRPDVEEAVVPAPPPEREHDEALAALQRARHLFQFPDCQETVVPDLGGVDGEEEPCNGIAIAWRVDLNLHVTYPVCLEHAQEPMATIAQLRDEIDRGPDDEQETPRD